MYIYTHIHTYIDICDYTHASIACIRRADVGGPILDYVIIEYVMFYVVS